MDSAASAPAAATARRRATGHIGVSSATHIVAAMSIWQHASPTGPNTRAIMLPAPLPAAVPAGAVILVAVAVLAVTAAP
jgi:hypothetical protein